MAVHSIDEDARRRFEAAWKDAPPRIEDFLPPPEHPSYEATLVELVAIDLELSWKRGSGRHPDEYLSRFPRLRESDGMRDLIGEWHARPAPAAAPPRPGDVLAGKYRVERVLGEGSMGVVVAATHLSLGTEVALKLMRPGLMTDPEAVQRFLREARAAARLESPHVARILDADRLEDGAPYIVLELLEGSDLTRVLRGQRRLSAGVACNLVAQACDALEEAHALGIIHRDLKPANLFLAATGRDGATTLKILDFGLAKARGTGEVSMTEDGTLLGSPAYMSPEQIAAARTVDGRSDIWSLGVILHQMLAGTLPFDGSSVAALALQVSREPAPPLPADVPPALAAVVRRCLEKAPGDRFANVAELRAALAPFRAAGAAVEATLPTPEPAASGPSTDVTADDGLAVVARARYRVGDEVGRGGLGRVLAAHDLRLDRQVALKELLGGGAAARARFLREALVTARLEHPAIVPIHEAGRWPSGEPFYAMKLVTGRSLAEAIDGARTLEERMALVPNLIAVGEAVAYAHSRRIIHRDLKPHNVVLGAFGEAVVVDWGLAKDLGAVDDTAAVAGEPAGPAGLTQAGAVVGTARYMPPEQAVGDAVDERADVYALGAMLYHLLAGVPPHDGGSAAAVLGEVVAGPPPPLGPRAPGVAADLVAIVDKAMARDRARRYPSAGELAADLRKFQTGQLVGAHRYSPWQLVRRWVRRHRAAVAVAAAAALLLGVLGALSLERIVAEQARTEEQRRLAEAQRAAAEKSRGEAEGLLTFMLVDLRDKLLPLGKVDLLGAVATKAVSYYQERPESDDDEDEARRALALHDLGEVFYQEGDLTAAVSATRAALAVRERLAARAPTSEKRLREVARSHGALGQMLQAQGDLPAAQAELRAALAEAERAAALDPGQSYVVATSHGALGAVLGVQGDSAGALAEFRAGAAIAEAILAGDAANSDALGLAARLHNGAGGVLRARGDLPAAQVELRAGLALAERRALTAPADARAESELLVAHGQLAEVLLAARDLDGALAEARAGQAVAERLAAHDPGNAGWQENLAAIHTRAGDVLRARGDLAGALVEYTASVAVAEKLTALDPKNAEWQRLLAVGQGRVGQVLEARKDWPGALAAYRASLASFEQRATVDPTNAVGQRDLVVGHGRVGDALDELGDHQAALAEHRARLAVAEKLAARDPSNASWQLDLAAGHESVGETLLELGDKPGALAELRAAHVVMAALAAAHPENPNAARMAKALDERADTCCR